jgi:chromosome segregation ATPase
MHLYLDIECPGCGRDLRVRDTYVGQVVFCNNCDQPFIPQAEAIPTEIPQQAAYSPAVDSACGNLADDDGRLQDLVLELATQRTETEALRQELQSANNTIAHAREQAHLATQERDEALAQVSQLVAEEARIRAEAKTLEELLEARLAEIGHLSTERETRKVEHARLSAERAQLQAAAEDREPRIARLSELLDEARRQHLVALDDAARQIAEAGSHWDVERGEYVRRIGSLEQQLALALAVHDDVTLELGQVRDSRALELRHLELELSALRDQLAERDRQSERERCSSSEREVEITSRYECELAQLVKSHVLELHELEVGLADVRDQIAERDRQIADERRSSAEQYTAAELRFRGELAQLHGILERSYAESTQERAEVERLLADLRVQSETTRAELQRARQALAAEELGHQEAIEQVSALSSSDEKWREQCAALRVECQESRDEIEHLKLLLEEAVGSFESLARERDALADAVSALKATVAHERDLAERGAMVEATESLAEPSDFDTVAVSSYVGDALRNQMSDAAVGAASGADRTGRALALVQDLLPAIAQDEELERDDPWPDDDSAFDPTLPNISSLSEARHQIAQLKRMLETAQVANRMLRAHFSEQGPGATRRQLREMAERAQQLEAELRAYRGKEETLWNANVARRARKLDRRG